MFATWGADTLVILTQVAYRTHLDKHGFLEIPKREYLISGRIYKELVRVVTSGRELKA